MVQKAEIFTKYSHFWNLGFILGLLLYLYFSTNVKGFIVTMVIISLLKMKIYHSSGTHWPQPGLLWWCRSAAKCWVTGCKQRPGCTGIARSVLQSALRMGLVKVATHNRWRVTNLYSCHCTLSWCCVYSFCVLVDYLCAGKRERERGGGEWDRRKVQGYTFNLPAVVMWLIVARGQGIV